MANSLLVAEPADLFPIAERRFAAEALHVAGAVDPIGGHLFAIAPAAPARLVKLAVDEDAPADAPMRRVGSVDLADLAPPTVGERWWMQVDAVRRVAYVLARDGATLHVVKIATGEGDAAPRLVGRVAVPYATSLASPEFGAHFLDATAGMGGFFDRAGFGVFVALDRPEEAPPAVSVVALEGLPSSFNLGVVAQPHRGEVFVAGAGGAALLGVVAPGGGGTGAGGGLVAARPPLAVATGHPARRVRVAGLGPDGPFLIRHEDGPFSVVGRDAGAASGLRVIATGSFATSPSLPHTSHALVSWPEAGLVADLADSVVEPLHVALRRWEEASGAFSAPTIHPVGDGGSVIWTDGLVADPARGRLFAVQQRNTLPSFARHPIERIDVDLASGAATARGAYRSSEFAAGWLGGWTVGAATADGGRTADLAFVQTQEPFAWRVLAMDDAAAMLREVRHDADPGAATTGGRVVAVDREPAAPGVVHALSAPGGGVLALAAVRLPTRDTPAELLHATTLEATWNDLSLVEHDGTAGGTFLAGRFDDGSGATDRALVLLRCASDDPEVAPVAPPDALALPTVRGRPRALMVDGARRRVLLVADEEIASGTAPRPRVAMIALDADGAPASLLDDVALGVAGTATTQRAPAAAYDATRGRLVVAVVPGFSIGGTPGGPAPLRLEAWRLDGEGNLAAEGAWEAAADAAVASLHDLAWHDGGARLVGVDAARRLHAWDVDPATGAITTRDVAAPSAPRHNGQPTWRLRAEDEGGRVVVWGAQQPPTDVVVVATGAAHLLHGVRHGVGWRLDAGELRWRARGAASGTLRLALYDDGGSGGRQGAAALRLRWASDPIAAAVGAGEELVVPIAEAGGAPVRLEPGSAWLVWRGDDDALVAALEEEVAAPGSAFVVAWPGGEFPDLLPAAAIVPSAFGWEATLGGVLVPPPAAMLVR